jgi:hypothetical protein
MVGMNLQQWVAAHFAAVFLLYFVGLWCAVSFVISWLSGWRLLARRFRASEAFYGETWSWQSVRFRGWCGYNNCVTVGASPEGLYLSLMLPFRLFHPALLISWREIEVETGKMFFGYYDTARFRIGTEERVTVKITGKLVDRVRKAAGPGWPLYQIDQMEARARG